VITTDLGGKTIKAPRAYVPSHLAVKSSQPRDLNCMYNIWCKDNAN